MSSPEEKRVFEEPVAWLFGRQLLAGAKWILLYTAFGTKLDARDWMQANEFAFEPAGGDEEFWFDYLSDTGDGMTATYSLAYLCMSELYADERVVRAGALRLGDAQPGEKADASDEVLQEARAGHAPLPRGRFLFIGGDTAYHMSDFQSLVQRIQVPFRWAFADHRKRDENFDIERRPVFGIPGNHDYYDQLDGFRRQFRLPVRSEDRHYKEEEFVFKAPQLMLSGFKRRQEASYVALRLPFGWRMWGLDTEVGRVDERQQRFFKSLCDPHPTDPERVLPPDKLIVATCAPTTVFGKLADKEDEKAADAFAQLGLEQPFLPAERELKDGGPGLESVTGDARLEDGQCRLDISGDVHHYARYWGPQTGADTRPGRGDVEAPASDSYASVVSGIGGAFHHPSQTFRGEIREQALYPAEGPSRSEVARRIFKFWNIRRGGAIHIFGFVIAFVLYFSASVPQSSSQVINAFPPLWKLGIPDTSRNADGALEQNKVTPTINTAQAPTLGPSGASGPRAAAAGGAGTSQNTASASPRYMYGPNPVTMPADFWVGLALLGAALAAIILAFVFSDRLFGARRRTVEAETGGGGREFRHKRVDPEIFDESGGRRVLLLTAVVTALTGVGFWMVRPYRDFITPFGNSLLVLFTVLWAAAAAALAIRYGEWLFKQAARRTVHKHEYWLQSALAVLAVLCVGVGVWSFGRNNLPALLLSDMLFVLVLVGAPLAILGMALALGATGMGTKGKLLMLALGVWHAILQVFVPFLLVRKGNWVTWVAAAALFFLPALFGGWMMKRNLRVPLLLAWIAYGVLMLMLPRLTAPDDLTARPFYYWAWMGWGGLWPSLLAAVIGALWACVCFGLYLGVALSFHGHNNEAGGAARIERFKEFVRFRINKDGLTAFVIAVDDPQQDGARLRPRLVDVFTLRAKGAAKS
ncbi:MAG TPA: hypothetical protein VER32_04460 [Pyrinomonadaceae bacterium]|nr:hypothetical protein [Pyrinomonadaceae bacterium]